MSAAPTAVKEVRPAATAAKPTATKPKRLRHTPGGITLGKANSREAQRTAAAILEVLAGMRTPGQAAEVLGVSLQRYFQLETRAMHALVQSCEARPKGRSVSADRELVRSRQQCERLQRELARQQTLVRMAQRTVGLTPPAAQPKPLPGKKRRRRPVVRALRAAKQLQEQSETAAPAEMTAAITEDAG